MPLLQTIIGICAVLILFAGAGIRLYSDWVKMQSEIKKPVQKKVVEIK